MLKFFNNDKDVFIFKGYAGTGKTSLIKGVIKYLISVKHPYTLMASTGRAAKILSEKTNLQASTIHSYIYRPKITQANNDSNNPTFRMTFDLAQNNDSSQTIYFIDESSMISNHAISGSALSFGTGRLLSDLFMFAGKRKVVFIGDTIQLPPINTKFSAALDKVYLKTNLGKKVKVSELTTVMRYGINSGIGWNTQNIRKTVNSGSYPYMSIRASEFDDSFIYNNEQEIVNEYTATIKRSGVNNTIFLVLSNFMVSRINNAVRARLFKQRRQNTLNKGESLMVIKNNYLYDVLNGDLIFYNHGNEIVNMAGLEFIKVQLRTDAVGQGARLIQAYIIKDLLLSSARDLSHEEEAKLMNNYYSRMTKIAEEVYSCITSSMTNTKRAKEMVNELINEYGYNISVPDKIFNNQLSKTKLKKEMILANMQNDPFLNAIRVKYGYAITCHKAQGGEWQDVFIMFEYSLFKNDKESQYRWAYTAISRAAKRVHYLTNMCVY
jgi:ATP-dependent exoDNAse (exonuclease V) alpha subunit